MRSRLAFVVAVALMAAACGKSQSLPNDGEGAGGSGRGGTAAVAGDGGATGAGGAVGGAGNAGSAGPTGGTPGTAGAAAGVPGTSGGAGAGASGSAGSIAGAGGAAGSIGAGGGGVAGRAGASGGGAAGRGGAGGTTATAGTGGAAAGATGTGGAAGAQACSTGETRCDASGHRLRCAADGSWADDNYVCTAALSGSSDYNTMCAIKADGRLACWASGDWANGQAGMMVARAPAASWRQISVGDGPFGMCAIATSGAISCWDVQGPLSAGSPPPATGTLATILVQHLWKLRHHDHRQPRLLQSFAAPIGFHRPVQADRDGQRPRLRH